MPFKPLAIVWLVWKADFGVVFPETYETPRTTGPGTCVRDAMVISRRELVGLLRWMQRHYWTPYGSP
jgi:hypothetical protein